MWTPACPCTQGDSRVWPSPHESNFAHSSEAAVRGAVARSAGTVSPVSFTAASGADLHHAGISGEGQLFGEFLQLCGVAAGGIAVRENTVSDLRFRGVSVWNYSGGNNAGHDGPRSAG